MCNSNGNTVRALEQHFIDIAADQGQHWLTAYVSTKGGHVEHSLQVNTDTSVASKI